MDLSLANLKSSNQFHKFHEELNRVLKIHVIALTFFRLELDKGVKEEEVKKKMYGSGELWGGMTSWKNPSLAQVFGLSRSLVPPSPARIASGHLQP